MRIVSEKCRRALSAILAAAMVLTSAPGTTMTAMAAEQTAASAPDTAVTEIAAEQAADGSEEAAADNTAVPEEGEKNALEGDGSEGETDNGENTDIQELESPVFTLNPSDGYVQNGEEASFTLTVPENSEVKYVIGEAGQSEAEVADPTTDDTTYNMEPVSVPAPDDIEGTTVVVKAVAVPAGDKADSFTSSAVVSAAFTFGPKKEAASEGEDPPIVLSKPVIVLSKTEADNRAEDVTFTLEELSDGIVKYTVDGTDPLSSGTAVEYTEETGAVHVEAPDTDEQAAVTVKAATAANRGGFTDSSVSSATVTFDGKKVTLTVDSKNYDAFTVELKETVAGQEKPLTVGEDHTVKVTKGAEISGEVRVKDDYEFVSVNFAETQWLDRADDKANVIVACEAVSGDLTLAVETKLAYEPHVYNEKFDYLAKLEKEGKNAGRYVINPGNYTFSILTKTGKLIRLDAATILIGGKAYTGDTQPEVRDDGTIALKIGKDLYGKDFDLEFKSGTKEADAASVKVTDTASFRVNDLLTGVKVKGADQKGGLTQAVRTTESYDLTYTPSTEGVRSQLAAFSTDAEKVDARTIDGKLWLTTAGEKTEKPVSVILYNTLLCSERELSEAVLREAGAVVAEVKVTVAEPAWAKTALAVKYADGTDTQIKVSVTAPAGVKADGDYYYIFDVMDPSTVSGNLPAESRLFIEQAETGTKTYTFKVIDAEAGKGTKKEFQVKAYLVQVDDSNAPADLQSTNIVAKTPEPKSSVKCSTKNPYYAEKISLKKETTTIYTGQTGVRIATVNYGKNTSFTRIENFLVEKDGIMMYDPEGIVVHAEEDGGVYASVSKDVEPGRYTVRLAAEAGSGMLPAMAELPITVVAGINDLAAAPSTDKIYLNPRTGGKAGILVAYDQQYTPRTPKVTYTLGRLSDDGFVPDEAPLGTDGKNKSFVTVSSKGAVTVAKDYQVKTDDWMANTFAVQVKAADYKENDTMTVVEFTVVSEAQELKRLVLLDKTGKEIVVDGKASVRASELDGARAVAIVGSEQVGEDRTYDCLPIGTYSLSVKGKGVTVDAWGSLHVTNPAATNITITATTTDGGNRKASLTIKKLTYDEKELRLVMGDTGREEFCELKESKGKTDENDLTISGRPAASGDNFEVRAVYTEDGETADATRFQNYSISVKGGAKIYDDVSLTDDRYTKNQRLVLRVTDVTKPITLTLTSGRTKKTYILKSKAEQLGVPTITLDKNQTLVAGKAGAQTLTFTVKGDVPEDAWFNWRWADRSSELTFSRNLSDGNFLPYDRETKKLTVTFNNVSKTGTGNLCFAMFVPKDGDEGGNTQSILSKPVKITAASMKKTFSVTNKYTMSAMDQSVIPITWKGSNVKDVEFALADANEKGQANGFTKAIGINDGLGTMYLTDKAVPGQTYTGCLIGLAVYEDGSTAMVSSKVTVKVLADNKPARSYKADNVTLIKGKTAKAQAQAMPVTIKAGKEEAAIAQAAAVTDKNGNAIPTIQVNRVENGKLSLDISKFAIANQEKGIQQQVMLKVVLAGAKDVATPAAENKYAVTLKFKVVVPKKMLYEEERAEVTPEISFSSESPANRAADVTFTVNVGKDETRQVKAFYYTTDGTEPAVDAKGRPLGTTKKYAGRKTVIPAPDTDEEQTVTVRVFVLAKDQTSYKNVTAEKSITFAAKAQDGE